MKNSNFEKNAEVQVLSTDETNVILVTIVVCTNLFALKDKPYILKELERTRKSFEKDDNCFMSIVCFNDKIQSTGFMRPSELKLNDFESYTVDSCLNDAIIFAKNELMDFRDHFIKKGVNVISIFSVVSKCLNDSLSNASAEDVKEAIRFLNDNDVDTCILLFRDFYNNTQVVDELKLLFKSTTRFFDAEDEKFRKAASFMNKNNIEPNIENLFNCYMLFNS